MSATPSIAVATLSMQRFASRKDTSSPAETFAPELQEQHPAVGTSLLLPQDRFKPSVFQQLEAVLDYGGNWDKGERRQQSTREIGSHHETRPHRKVPS